MRPVPRPSLALERLARQQLAAPRFARPEDIVRWFGAVQAQDQPGACWAIGQRLPDAVEADVEAAVAARRIVRTWPMRGTLHYVAAEDAGWMLRLLAPRVIARAASRYRELGLDDAAFKKARALSVKALRGGRALTRPALYEAFARGGVSPEGQRGLHLLGHLAQQCHLCFGPRQGKQPTVVLFEEWLPARDDPPRDEALARLAARYFASHGPATLADFAWWTGLPVGEARRAIAAAGAELTSGAGGAAVLFAAAQQPARLPRGPLAALLPPWDELLVAYRDRSAPTAALPARRRDMIIGRPLLVVDGLVRGAWRRERGKAAVRVDVELWTALAAAERRAVEAAAERYGRFLGTRVLLRISSSASRRSP